MNHADQTALAGWDGTAGPAMAAQLAREERVRATLGAVLPQLVGIDEGAALAEELVIRTRAAMAALAGDLLRDCGDETAALAPELARALSARPALLAHAHSLALEAGTAERLAGLGLDPVLTPVLERFLAGDRDTATLAMAVLAAQARFTSRQRRMDMISAELPADLMHEALVALADVAGPEGHDRAAALRAGYDEARTRLALLGRLALVGAVDGAEMLDPAATGWSLFATVLAQRAGVPREEAVLAGATGQDLRLALLLRTAGAEPEATEAAVAMVHPQVQVPAGWARVPAAAAAALLAGGTA